MNITTQNHETYTEVLIEGRLDTNTAQEVQDALTKQIEEGNENLLLNLKDLNYISSAGLRVFLVGAKMLEPKGKKINFCNMQDFIKEVFDIAGFSILFNFYNSPDEFQV